MEANKHSVSILGIMHRGTPLCRYFGFLFGECQPPWPTPPVCLSQLIMGRGSGGSNVNCVFCGDIGLHFVRWGSSVGFGVVGMFVFQ